MAIPKAYDGKEPYIFISYAHKDSEKVLPIIQALQDRGFRVWYDEGLEVGSSWSDMIEEYLYNCACTICFVSPNFLNSPNCKDEIDYAKEINKSPLIVYLEDIQPDRKFQFRYGRLHALKYTDFSGMGMFMDKLESTDALLPCLGKKPEPSPKSAPAAKPAPKPVPVTKPAPPKPSSPEELYQQGKKYYDKKQYSEAIPLLQKAAEQGHAEAQFRLGWCHFVGNGVPRDSYEAGKLYLMAAKQGHVQAQFEYGDCCYKNHCGPTGTKLDRMKEGIIWYQKAAEQGYAKAQYELARCYYSGYGTPTELQQALHWMQKAAQQEYQDAASLVKTWPEVLRQRILTYQEFAEQNYPQAQYELAQCYYLGCGVAMDLQQALHWMQKAAQQKYQDAESLSKTWAEELRLKHLTPEEMVAQGLEHDRNGNYKDAVTWFRKASDAGNPLGKYHVACCYAEGKGVPQNIDHALDYYIDLLENHFSFLSTHSVKWSGVFSHSLMNPFAQNFAAACSFAVKHSKKYTDEYLCTWLTGFLTRFTPVPNGPNIGSPEKVGDLLRLAKSFDHNWLFTPSLIICRYIVSNNSGKNQGCTLSAMQRIADHYIYGHGVKKDFSEAAKWLHAAADIDDDFVYMVWYYLIALYKNGWGVNKSWLTAQSWRSRFTTLQFSKYSKFDKDVLENVEDKLRSAYSRDISPENMSMFDQW